MNKIFKSLMLNVLHGIHKVDITKASFPTCNMCGSKMTEFDGVFWYTCPECGNSVRITEEGTTWEHEIFGFHKKTTGRKCISCGQSLDGGTMVDEWEEGDNSSAYVVCPHCGAHNY